MRDSWFFNFFFFLYRGRFRGDTWGGRGGAPPVLCNHLFFCDYIEHVPCFEELQTVSIKVKLIIHNVPFTYVYPNTIKTY